MVPKIKPNIDVEPKAIHNNINSTLSPDDDLEETDEEYDAGTVMKLFLPNCQDEVRSEDDGIEAPATNQLHCQHTDIIEAEDTDTAEITPITRIRKTPKHLDDYVTDIDALFGEADITNYEDSFEDENPDNSDYQESEDDHSESETHTQSEDSQAEVDPINLSVEHGRDVSSDQESLSDPNSNEHALSDLTDTSDISHTDNQDETSRLTPKKEVITTIPAFTVN